MQSKEHFFISKAPCSFMIMGEYFVLSHCGQAIVLAVKNSVSVKLFPLPNQKTIYFSSHLDQETILDRSLTKNPFLRKVLEIFNPPCGCEIYVSSDADPSMGMGTSAAFAVSLVRVFQQWLTSSFSLENTFLIALDVVRYAQDGYGSGADVAASVYGGLIHYQKHKTEPLFYDWNFFASYVGYKTKTTDMIQYVEKQNPPHYLYDSMKKCTNDAIESIKNKDLESFGRCMNIYHGLLSALGVSDKNMEDLVYRYRALEGVCGSKISGSGLGDCVIFCAKKIIEEQDCMPLISFYNNESYNH
jgi:mevalonate kinase